MRTERVGGRLAGVGLAAAAALPIAWLDLRASEVQGTLLLLMLVAFAIAAARLAPAWQVAAAVAAGFTGFHVGAAVAGVRGALAAPLATLLAALPVLAAAYGGAAAAALVRRAAVLVPLGGAGDDALPWYARPVGSRALLAAALVGPALLGLPAAYLAARLRHLPAAAWVAGVWQVLTLLLWTAVAPAVVRRRPAALAPVDLARLGAALAAAAAAHAAAVVLGSRALGIPAGAGGVAAAVGRAVLLYLPLDALTLVLLGVVAYASDARRHAEAAARAEAERAAVLRAELAASRMAALRAQLRPHFFLNALNAALTLARRGDVDALARLLGGLGDLLRYALADHPDLVPLDQELRFAEQYLAVERVRFPERLRATVDADDAARSALVPPLLLQTLVENALHHGVARRAAAGVVAVRAWTDGGAAPALHLRVEDDGPGPPPGDSDAPGGVGLTNARARLAAIFGGAATLSLAPRAAGGAVAEAVMPLVTRRG